MKTIHSQLIAILLLVVGVCLFLGGVAGLGSLYMVSKNCESTTGVVKKYDRKRVYRHRKIRYESTMLVSYSTPKYGEMHVYKKSHCPFREVGDELTVWYDRNRPEAIRLPVSPFWYLGCFRGIMYIRWNLLPESDEERMNNYT